MNGKRSANRKARSLKKAGCLNPSPESVKDELFAGSDFFDANDLVQVKYEMVRRVQADGKPISQVAADFGFSRPSYYQAQTRLKEGGIAALVPQKPGPRRSHKLDEAVMDYLREVIAEEPALKPVDLAKRIQMRFDITVHPRSIERSLQRQKKKRTRKSSDQ